MKKKARLQTWRRLSKRSSTYAFSVPYLDESVKRDRIFAANHISYRLQLLSKINLPLVAAMWMSMCQTKTVMKVSYVNLPLMFSIHWSCFKLSLPSISKSLKILYKVSCQHENKWINFSLKKCIRSTVWSHLALLIFKFRKVSDEACAKTWESRRKSFVIVYILYFIICLEALK